jgi:hypothetical protein
MRALALAFLIGVLAFSGLPAGVTQASCVTRADLKIEMCVSCTVAASARDSCEIGQAMGLHGDGGQVCDSCQVVTLAPSYSVVDVGVVSHALLPVQGLPYTSALSPPRLRPPIA